MAGVQLHSARCEIRLSASAVIRKPFAIRIAGTLSIHNDLYNASGISGEQWLNQSTVWWWLGK
jgi:hypothetical protein